jgi:hypothetical protein
MSRRGPVDAYPRYFVSPRWQFDQVLDTRSLIDAALHSAKTLSARNPGAILFVWQKEDRGEPRVRAFAEYGVVRWCKRCPSCLNFDPTYCHVCKGLASVEDP